MKPIIEKILNENLKLLKSIIGLEIKTAIEEQFFIEGELSEELGTLKLQFTNDLEMTFDIYSDVETLKITNGGFTHKESVHNTYKWGAKKFLNSKELLKLGKIHKCYIQWCEWHEYKHKTQTACKIEFESSDFL